MSSTRIRSGTKDPPDGGNGASQIGLDAGGLGRTQSEEGGRERRSARDSSRSVDDDNPIGTRPDRALIRPDRSSTVQLYTPDEAVRDAQVELDADHYGIVAVVLYRDTADDRALYARQLIADTVSDIQPLEDDLGHVGSREQVDAIWRTGACPDARYWWLAAWFLMLLDWLFWYIANAQIFGE